MGKDNAFFIENQIYYHDTDAGGVVYYAKYFEHLEEGRNQFCKAKGVDLAEWAKKGLHFPVAHAEVNYKAPARYGDTIRIYTFVKEIGNSSIHFLQEIKIGDRLLVGAKTIWVCVGDDFKARDVPQEIRKALS